jgi:hypothetical protein
MPSGWDCRWRKPGLSGGLSLSTRRIQIVRRFRRIKPDHAPGIDDPHAGTGRKQRGIKSHSRLQPDATHAPQMKLAPPMADSTTPSGGHLCGLKKLSTRFAGNRLASRQPSNPMPGSDARGILDPTLTTARHKATIPTAIKQGLTVTPHPSFSNRRHRASPMNVG